MFVFCIPITCSSILLFLLLFQDDLVPLLYFSGQAAAFGLIYSYKCADWQVSVNMLVSQLAAPSEMESILGSICFSSLCGYMPRFLSPMLLICM